jgi:hypothetical protein
VFSVEMLLVQFGEEFAAEVEGLQAPAAAPSIPEALGLGEHYNAAVVVKKGEADGAEE